MKIQVDILRRFVDLPADPRAVRTLLDEVGVEVKRFDPSAPGVPMTLELLANRGDHHAYVGIAREVVGRLGGGVRLPEVAELSTGDSPHPVVIEADDLCGVYSLTRLRGPAGGSLGAEALALLAAGGLASKGAVIDATNVANLELGQPTHAFDAAKVVGPIRVRRARPGEQAWPLFQPGRVTVPEGALVIADDEKILAVAGVIGCEESKTTEATTEVLLESAAFDPVSVRKAARAMGLSTDSSARFERGSDHALPLVGAGRVAALLASAGWSVVGASGREGSWRDPLRVVSFRPAAARAFLGFADDDGSASDAALVDRLTRYGFRVGPTTDLDVQGNPRVADALDVLVPSWRLWDVEHPSDLYEELARSYGYDATPQGLPPVDLGSVPSDAERAWERAMGVFVAQGFHEVISDGFYSRQLREKLGITEGHALWDHVETANALDRAYSLLKNNALGQAVELVATNLAVQNAEIKAFERTRLFRAEASAPNGLCREHNVIWAVASGSERPRTWAGAGRPADAVFFKGLVTELGRALGLPLRFASVDAGHELASLLHPGRRLAVTLNGAVVGVFGEVHPDVLAGFKIKRARPVFLQLDADAVLVAGARAPYEEPPSTQPMVRDLAFSCPRGVEAADVAATLSAAAPAHLANVSVIDRFDHELDGRQVTTWTFQLVFAVQGADRSADEVNALLQRLAEAVEGALGGRGVRLRGA